MSAGDRGRAMDVLRAAWPEIELTASEQQTLLGQSGALLSASDHIARLDALVWAERAGEARRMYPLVDDGHRRLAEARLRLAGRQAGVDAAIAAVPTSLQNDPGLVYERLRWRRRADRTAQAIELFAQQPAAPQHADRWWRERHILARRLFNAGDYSGAYAVASGHRQTEGFPALQAHWFSGFVALRFLDRADLATGHFRQLYERAMATETVSPISRARGAYWTGRAHEAAGNTEEARRWFETAAAYTTAFYGQMAAERIGRPSVAELPAPPAISAAASSQFAADERVRVVQQTSQLGETDFVDSFLWSLLSTADDPPALAQVAELGQSVGRTFVTVRAGKAATRLGTTIDFASYPLPNLSTADPRVERPLVLGIIRQESEFRTDAVSPAGARGLMQLMPQTAQSVARQLGVSHAQSMLTVDEGHNVRLGSSYLAGRISRFGGSYVLAIAAYNAGDHRVDRWLAQYGDPRTGSVDMIDWIESIPFYETRNYVQRVLESTQVYRQRLGEAPLSGALERDLTR